MIVLDTSVIVKWFSEEEFTEKALKIREKIRNEQEIGAFPDLFLYELSNALKYNPNFDKEDVREAVQSILDMDMEIITPTSDIINRSISMAFERDITIYDASYVALAEELEISLITADENLYEKVKDLEYAIFIKEADSFF